MNGIILFAGLLLLLWLGRPIFIPMLVAVFLWYLINAIAAYYRRVIPFKATKTKLIPISRALDWLSILLAGATLCVVVYIFATQVRPMFSELFIALPAIQARLISLGHYLSSSLGFDFDASLVPNITQIAANVGASAASVATSMGMILIYMLFMFIEQSTFNRKFAAMFNNKRRARKVHYILQSIDENMKKYLFIKTTISALTGLCAYIWLRAIGLEFAGVWGFIVFVMNYIPTIGSVVACALPILFAMIVDPSFNLAILVAAGLIGMQILLGNVVEPKLTGKTLNLSTLAILINLVFWGMIWGIAGMFFSVPLLVATFIITAQFDSTRPIAVLLSANGKIPDKRDE